MVAVSKWIASKWWYVNNGRSEQMDSIVMGVC